MRIAINGFGRIGRTVYRILAENNIQHYWQIFTHPEYDQGKPFIEKLSIIDLLFNMGPASREIVFSCGYAEEGPYRAVSKQ